MAKKYNEGRFPAPQQPTATTHVAEEQSTPPVEEQLQDSQNDEVVDQPNPATTEPTGVETTATETQEAATEETSAGEEKSEEPTDPDTAVQETVVEAPVVEQAPVAAPVAPTPVAQPAPQPVATANLENPTVDEQTLIDFFKDYAQKMAKGRPVTPNDIAANQVAWFRRVMIVLELEPKSFRRVMDFLMSHILEEMDGAYHPARRMRGMTAQLRLSDRERIQFQVLMQLFCDMADPAGRDAMRSQTSAEKALGNGLSETARTRLGDYFRLG